jgi:hypothetical protein
MASAFDKTQIEQSHAVGKENKTYSQPTLFVAGKAVDLVQGPMNGGYSDTCNNWYSNWAKANHCG